MAAILRGTQREIERVARALRAGDVAGVPTETVYGLAADALNAKACRRIFQVKGRPQSDPLIVHVRGVTEAAEIAEVGKAARKVIRTFWPGPLTLVLEKKAVVPDIVTAGRGSVAVRAPSHPMMRKLLAAVRRPLAAPSANRFGYVSPTTAEHVQEGLGKRIKWILDGGPCAIGVESTILDLRDESRPRVLRPGAIGAAEIERVLGVKVAVGETARAEDSAGAAANDAEDAGKGTGMIAPGMLARHYSPRTRVVLHRAVPAAAVMAGSDDAAWILITVPAALRARANVFSWAEEARLESVGRALFARLREADRGKWAVLHVQMAPGRSPLAVAINDRLRRAAAR